MADTVGNICWGKAVVSVGAVDAAPDTEMGITSEDGVKAILRPTFKRVRSGGYLLAVKMIPEDLEVLLEGGLLESTLTNFDLLWSVGAQAALDGTGVVTEKSCKFVGTKLNTGGGTRTVTASRGVFIQEIEHPFKIGSDSEWIFPFQFAVLKGTTAHVLSIADSA